MTPRWPTLGRRDTEHTPPPAVLAVLGAYPTPGTRGPQARDRLLAAAQSGDTWLLATVHRFGAIEPDGTVCWLRPWHDVDAASWGRQSSTLTVTFVDGGRPVMLPMANERTFLQALRERVQASVVMALELPLEGPRKAKAVIRQDFATGDLVEQLVLSRGTRPSDAISAAAEAAFVTLREETGIPPR